MPIDPERYPETHKMLRQHGINPLHVVAGQIRGDEYAMLRRPGIKPAGAAAYRELDSWWMCNLPEELAGGVLFDIHMLERANHRPYPSVPLPEAPRRNFANGGYVGGYTVAPSSSPSYVIRFNSDDEFPTVGSASLPEPAGIVHHGEVSYRAGVNFNPINWLDLLRGVNSA